MTATQIITAALRAIGRLKGPGQGAAAEELAEGLVSLNKLLENWSTERLNVYSIETGAFDLASGTSTYTIGPSGTWDTARPIRIVSATAAAPSSAGTGNMRSPVEILPVEKWNSIELRDATIADLPTALYYDAAFPIGNVSVFPAFVSSAATKLELSYWVVLAAFADLTTPVSLPPGYDRALIYALAVEISSSYGKVPSPAVLQSEAEAKAAIRTLNESVQGAGEATTAETNAVEPKK